MRLPTRRTMKMPATLRSAEEVVRHEMPHLSDTEVRSVTREYLRQLQATGLSTHIYYEGDTNEEI